MSRRFDPARPDALDVHAQRMPQPVIIVGRETEVRLEPAINARVAIVVHRHTIRYALVEHGQHSLA